MGPHYFGHNARYALRSLRDCWIRAPGARSACREGDDPLLLRALRARLGRTGTKTTTGQQQDAVEGTTIWRQTQTLALMVSDGWALSCATTTTSSIPALNTLQRPGPRPPRIPAR